MIKCRAAVLLAANQPVVVEEIIVAPPQPGEVRVKLGASGVCGTDVHASHGLPSLPVRYPVILGHEGSGIVESVGDGVTKVAPGDRVLLHYLERCGQCRVCKGSKKTNNCPAWTPLLTHVRRTTNDTRFSRASDGSPIYYFFGLSTFSEYTVVGQEQVCKLEPQISQSIKDETLCLIGCGVPTGYGAAINIAGVGKGNRVGVWGLGPVGLSAIQGARKAGAAKIIGIDLNERRFELATKLGATQCINPTKLEGGPSQLAKHVQAITDGGLDHAIDCSGSPHAIQAAFDSLFFEGTLTVMGAGRPTDTLTIGIIEPLKGKTLTGGTFGGYHEQDLPALIKEVIDGQLHATELITSRISLDQVQAAMDSSHDGSQIKSVIIY